MASNASPSWKGPNEWLMLGEHQYLPLTLPLSGKGGLLVVVLSRRGICGNNLRQRKGVISALSAHLWKCITPTLLLSFGEILSHGYFDSQFLREACCHHTEQSFAVLQGGH